MVILKFLFQNCSFVVWRVMRLTQIYFALKCRPNCLLLVALHCQWIVCMDFAGCTLARESCWTCAVKATCGYDVSAITVSLWWVTISTARRAVRLVIPCTRFIPVPTSRFMLRSICVFLKWSFWRYTVRGIGYTRLESWSFCGAQEKNSFGWMPFLMCPVNDIGELWFAGWVSVA